MFSYTKLMQAMVAAGVVTPTDPYFNLVTLLLPGDGTNGAQNNTFLDSSSNNFTITRNGNTTQGTFSPFSQTGWSNYFGGSYLETTATQIIPATGDFTIEAFVYVASLSTNPIIVSQGTTGTAGRTIFYITTAGNLYFFSNAVTAQSTGTITANSWNYVAVTRTGSSLAFYINGSASGTATVSSTVENTVLRIGRYWNTDQDLTGYISNLRISNIVRTISSTPTSAFTSDANTILLTCQSNRFVDASSNAYALTPTNSPSVQPFSPFAPTAAYSAATVGGSGYFDGSGDYLSIADNAALTVSGNVDMFVEAFVYLNSTASKTVINKSGVNGVSYANWKLSVSTNATIFFGNSGSPGSIVLNLTGATTLTTGQWFHIVATKKYVGGGSVNEYRLFVNGKLDAYSTAGNPSDPSATGLTIGVETSNTDNLNGYVQSLRFSNSSIPTSYQTSNTTVGTSIFTPPTAPVTTTSQGASNVQLLCNFTNAGITDATAKNDLETVGNASISTAQSKFGGGSMYFDGTGDYLSIPASKFWYIGTGDYTIEAWIYPTAWGDLLSCFKTTSPYDGWNLQLGGGASSNGVIDMFVSNGTTTADYVGVSAMSLNTWTHIAVVKSGTTLYQFINGTLDKTTTGILTPADSNNVLLVGVSNLSTRPYTGYIDDLRITKGYARYTANFTPTTVTFPLQ